MSLVENSQWVINRKFDLVFFLCPILLGLLYFLSLNLAPSHALLITAIVWVLFAQTHFGSTWFIFFDKKNRAHYRKHAFTYYVMPVIIMLAVLAIGYVNQSFLIILIAIASLYHVTKQNIGILQLYRMRNKETDLFEKKIETYTIFAWTLFFGVYGALQLPNFIKILVPVLPVIRIGCAALLVCAVIGSILLLQQFFRRKKNSLPKNVFLVTSILMYSPYIYASVFLVNIYQMEIATLTSLIAHYMQYIGLVWLININKYASDGTETAKNNRLLHVISKSYGYIVAAIVAYALFTAFLRWGIPPKYTVLFAIVPNIVAGLMVIHFYIDSFIWRFRDPFVRETVLPYIKPVETAVS